MQALSRTDVVRRLRGIQPEAAFTHVVLVGEQLFPVKQAYGVVTGEDRLDFNTVKARRFFRRLGFEVSRLDDEASIKHP